MFARVVTFQRSPAASGEATSRKLLAEFLPLLQRQPGYLGTYVLADRARRKHVGISFWDTEEHAAGSATLNEVRDRTSRELGDPAQPLTELFEVDIAQAPTAASAAQPAARQGATLAS